MMKPIIDDGWLVVSYEGPDTATVQVGYHELVGVTPEKWYPAYLDYHEGQRVAKIQNGPRKTVGHSKKTYAVYIRINGEVARAGNISV